ncbi:ATP-binding cassette domain-containing protein [Roseibium porphyridii]|uniref:ATP-binding cassette domain-containing protein n=1 Tax=Roseibium porphyridii TaxID=2866279 RepID=A0ABY8F6D6_9HYPH|nr:MULTISPECIES: ATP-binding cassette domain-containing protein [Stappiaceae]QFT30326.1 Nickel import ATP-binding protein NikE [Labrenzia sp. THAF82]WFE90974.1 ATP-binding cassette domain-containing protein [Roseibium sp. KMA01]
MLSVTKFSKRYYGRTILRDISLTIGQGEVVGLIGRSGAGKSTLARCLVGLEKPSTGDIRLNGASIVPGKGSARRKLQYLWQDPVQSLSPYLSAHGAVMEALNGFAIGAPNSRKSNASAYLNDLGVTPDMQARRPHALSGGQCQRVALARAIAADPQVLILDEPLSALDFSTRVQAIEMLQKLHQDTGLAMLIVSHDLAPLQHLASRILVLDDAQIVEDIPMKHFAERAAHKLSRAYIRTLATDPATEHIDGNLPSD